MKNRIFSKDQSTNSGILYFCYNLQCIQTKKLITLKRFYQGQSFTMQVLFMQMRFVIEINVYCLEFSEYSLWKGYNRRKTMRKGSSNICLSLPRIHPKLNSQNQTKRTQVQKDELMDQENELVQIKGLDQWTCRNYQPKTKGSKLITALYRDSINRYDRRRESIHTTLVMDAKLYLVRLQSELKKVYEIDYPSIFKNIEYCSGMYENFYSMILKTLQRSIDLLTVKYRELGEGVQKDRLMHIKSMEKSGEKDNYKEKIPLIREQIECKERQLEPIKNIIQNLKNAKITALKHCLYLGYDVREEGLIWILRQLGEIPARQCFPPFLNDNQLVFIINRFNKLQNSSIQEESTLKQNINLLNNKSPEQICDIISRKKKRELSMINQGAVLQELNQLYHQSLSPQRHKYLNDEILKLAESDLPKTKATKYQVIYQETLKKLNKFCINEIYKKNVPTKKGKDIVENRRESLNTLKILSIFQAKIEDYLRKANTTQIFINSQEKELDQIIRNLRYESYQESGKSERRNRNIVSIMCCLVGWKKAKKIIEQEMNYVF